MFDEILGIPAHPLIVHAAVVLVPLQVVSAIVYAFVPVVRSKIDWAVASLIVVGPAAAWAARQSGQAFRTRKIAEGVDPGFLAKIDAHKDFADATAWATIVLAVLTVLLFLWTRRLGTTNLSGGMKIANLALSVAILGIGVATAYYTFRAGDSGAHMVWG